MVLLDSQANEIRMQCTRIRIPISFVRWCILYGFHNQRELKRLTERFKHEILHWQRHHCTVFNSSLYAMLTSIYGNGSNNLSKLNVTKIVTQLPIYFALKLTHSSAPAFINKWALTKTNVQCVKVKTSTNSQWHYVSQTLDVTVMRYVLMFDLCKSNGEGFNRKP